jgi:hypothetical protein
MRQTIATLTDHDHARAFAVGRVAHTERIGRDAGGPTPDPLPLGYGRGIRDLDGVADG